MKDQTGKYIRTLLIVLVPLLLLGATPGQFQPYTQGSIIDMGLYFITGPSGDGWLKKLQDVLIFYRPITRSETDQIIIMVVKYEFDAQKGRYSSEEEVVLEDINNFEEGLAKNAKEGNCLTNDMKKGTTVIGDKKLYFISSIATGCTVGAASRVKARYIFFPADFNERHSSYQFLMGRFRDKEPPFKEVDLNLITPVIESLKIKPQMKAKPKDAKDYFEMGLTYFQKGDNDQAILYFSKYIGMDSKNPWAYSNRGAAYVAKGQYDQGISDFNKALEIDPRHAATYNNRGTAFTYKGEVDQAISDHTKAIEINPKNAGYYNNRGVAYGKKGQFDQAISDYDKALEINPSYAEAYDHRGNAYADKDQFDRAISDHTKAIEINPKNAGYYNNRGVAYRKKGEHDQAILDFNKALEISPKHAMAYYNRGWTYYLKKEYDKSWEDINKAQDLGLKVPSKFLDDLRKGSGRER